MNTQADAPRRGRPPKTEPRSGGVEARGGEIKRERRRRTDTLSTKPRRLSVPEGIKEKYADYELRWINADDTRMYQMTKNDDWDPVSTDGPNEGKGTGSEVRVPVGRTRDQVGSHAVLCAKRKEFVEEDRLKKKQIADKRAQDLRRGRNDDPEAIGTDGMGYIPNEGISLPE